MSRVEEVRVFADVDYGIYYYYYYYTVMCCSWKKWILVYISTGCQSDMGEIMIRLTNLPWRWTKSSVFTATRPAIICFPKIPSRLLRRRLFWKGRPTKLVQNRWNSKYNVAHKTRSKIGHDANKSKSMVTTACVIHTRRSVYMNCVKLKTSNDNRGC